MLGEKRPDRTTERRRSTGTRTTTLRPGSHNLRRLRLGATAPTLRVARAKRFHASPAALGTGAPPVSGRLGGRDGVGQSSGGEWRRGAGRGAAGRGPRSEGANGDDGLAATGRVPCSSPLPAADASARTVVRVVGRVQRRVRDEQFFTLLFGFFFFFGLLLFASSGRFVGFA